MFHKNEGNMGDHALSLREKNTEQYHSFYTKNARTYAKISIKRAHCKHMKNIQSPHDYLYYYYY